MNGNMELKKIAAIKYLCTTIKYLFDYNALNRSNKSLSTLNKNLF